jgi:hypothetical protein
MAGFAAFPPHPLDAQRFPQPGDTFRRFRGEYAPQRRSQPAQRDDLLFLFFAQEIAHVTERNLSACSMS